MKASTRNGGGWACTLSRALVVLGLLFSASLKVLYPGDDPAKDLAHTWLAQLRHPAMSLSVAAVEALLAAALLSRWWRPAAAVAFFVLLGFGVVFAWIVAAGLPTRTCGCFGSWDPPIAAHFGLILSMLLATRTMLIEPSVSTEQVVTPAP